MRNKLVKINAVILAAEFLAHVIVGVVAKNSNGAITILSVSAISGIWSGLAFLIAAITCLSVYLKPSEKIFFIATQIRFLSIFATLAVNAFIYLIVTVIGGIGGVNSGINGLEILSIVLLFLPPVVVIVSDTVAAFLKRREELKELDSATNPYYKRTKAFATAKAVALTVQSVLCAICFAFMLLMATGF